MPIVLPVKSIHILIFFPFFEELKVSLDVLCSPLKENGHASTAKEAEICFLLKYNVNFLNLRLK